MKMKSATISLRSAVIVVFLLMASVICLYQVRLSRMNKNREVIIQTMSKATVESLDGITQKSATAIIKYEKLTNNTEKIISAYRKGHWVEAERLRELGFNGDDIEYSYWRGYALLHGLGVKQDDDRAYINLKYAAKNGCVAALDELITAAYWMGGGGNVSDSFKKTVLNACRSGCAVKTIRWFVNLCFYQDHRHGRELGTNMNLAPYIKSDETWEFWRSKAIDCRHAVSNSVLNVLKRLPSNERLAYEMIIRYEDKSKMEKQKRYALMHHVIEERVLQGDFTCCPYDDTWGIESLPYWILAMLRTEHHKHIDKFSGFLNPYYLKDKKSNAVLTTLKTMSSKMRDFRENFWRTKVAEEWDYPISEKREIREIGFRCEHVRLDFFLNFGLSPYDIYWN